MRLGDDADDGLRRADYARFFQLSADLDLDLFRNVHYSFDN